ncbi:MAG: hypothetical protein ABII02_03180 [Candidatus Magasanikbacteria bacterium]
MMEHIFGFLTAVLGTLSMTLGLGLQYLKHRKEGRFGMSAIFMFLGTSVLVTRALYVVAKEAYWQLIPDCIGLLVSFLLIAQWWGMRGQEKNTETKGK